MSLINSQIVNNGASSPYGKGVATIIEGLFPPSTNQVLQGVGLLNEKDYVEIIQIEAVAGFEGFVYDPAGSTYDSLGGTGVVSIITAQGGTSPAQAILVQVRVFRNP